MLYAAWIISMPAAVFGRTSVNGMTVEVALRILAPPSHMCAVRNAPEISDGTDMVKNDARGSGFASWQRIIHAGYQSCPVSRQAKWSKVTGSRECAVWSEVISGRLLYHMDIVPANARKHLAPTGASRNEPGNEMPSGRVPGAGRGFG